MTVHYTDDWLTVLHGDVRDELRALPDESVHCVVTSPPFWGLRDYGTPGQLGLEPTPEQYVENMVAVFREVRRVLRSDGTLWLNLGDSYAATPTGNRGTKSGLNGADGERYGATLDRYTETKMARAAIPIGLKPKDLVGIPWRVAFALQADGWYLRSDIIWSKPNPMPESVTDRPTKSHEYLFLLSKSARYYFDADAVREQSSDTPGAAAWRRTFDASLMVKEAAMKEAGVKGGNDGMANRHPLARNIRSVWTIATAPYPGAHFATFPPKLVEPCIKAGTSERGVCPLCGAQFVRVVERDVEFTSGSGRAGNPPNGKNGDDYEQGTSGTYDVRMGPSVRTTTTGWRKACDHYTDGEAKAVVLDPFAGSGTTGMVAQSLSRRAVLIDLNVDYLGQLMERNRAIPLGLTEPAA